MEVFSLASYIYTKVKEVVGGNIASSGFQKDWSPNKIKSLFVMRDFILVVDHLQGPRIVYIDAGEVALDLQNPNRVGSLNNLLSSRQLSCLEEIYADSLFSQFPGVLDLRSYAESVINSASRLRYYAYVSGINPKSLFMSYRDALMNMKEDFTFAKNVGGFEYVDTKNVDWYKKHNLRPQYYGPDSERGKLSIWFNKVESYCLRCEDAVRASSMEDAVNRFILARVLEDISLSKEIGLYRSLCKIKSSYPLHMDVSRVCSIYQGVQSVDWLTKERVIEAAKSSGRVDDEFVTNIRGISQYYEKIGLYGNGGDLTPDADSKYPKCEGFIRLGEKLDNILARVYQENKSKNEYRLTVIMGIQQSFPNGIPEGALSLRLKDNVRVCNGTPHDYIRNYLTALYSICGMMAKF